MRRLSVSVERGVRLPLARRELRAQCLRALRLCGFDGALSLAVVGDPTMRAVNRDFHATDAPTDVLAFPLGAEDAATARDSDAFDAEVVLSAETAEREARERGVEPSAELMLYFVHGVLHLLGEDDHDPREARRMHGRALAILAELGHVNTIEMPRRRRERGG